MIQVTCIDIYDRPKKDVQETYRLQWNLNYPVPRNDFPEGEKFDLINSRFLVDGIGKDRWEPLIGEYKKLLKRGGWLQMAEVQWIFHSKSNHALPELARWSEAFYDALRSKDRRPDVASKLDQFVRFGGFASADDKTHDIPVGSWRPGKCSHMFLLTALRAARLTDIQKTNAMKVPSP